MCRRRRRECHSTAAVSRRLHPAVLPRTSGPVRRSRSSRGSRADLSHRFAFQPPVRHLFRSPRRRSEFIRHEAAQKPQLCLPEFNAAIGHSENRLMTPMNRANRSCRQWAYQTRLAMHLVRLGLVASIGLAPSVVRQSRLTLPQDRLSASTIRPISGLTLSQRIHKQPLTSLVTYANYSRLTWRYGTRGS